jgi:hypothetical protein
MQSSATTVSEYLASLPEDRRKAMSAVRKVVRANLPAGVVETMNWGMISYEVPLKKFPNTYNGQPLMYAALASQKNYMSLHLMGIYGDEALRIEFEEAYRVTGKRLDIGKACIRFKKLDDLPLDVVADAVGGVSLDEFISLHEQAWSLRKTKRARA